MVFLILVLGLDLGGGDAKNLRVQLVRYRHAEVLFKVSFLWCPKTLVGFYGGVVTAHASLSKGFVRSLSIPIKFGTRIVGDH